MIVRMRVVFSGSAGSSRAELAAFIEVLDLPEEPAIAELEAAEVVLAVRIVVFVEVIEVDDLPDRSRLHHIRQLIDSGGQQDRATR